MMLFAALEIAITGYYQVMVDGASYLAAHEAALGVADVTGAVSSVFNQVTAANVLTTATTVDNTNVPVNYNYADTLNRHGGASLVRPQHLQGQVSFPNVTSLLTFDGTPPKSISVGSSFIEPNNIDVDYGLNVQGSDPNSVTSADEKAFLRSGMNDPPFMVGFHMFAYCGTAPFDTTCPTQNFTSVGLAEVLDSDNWNNAANGIAPGAVFGAMSCHQQVYANISTNDFPAAYPGGPPGPPPATYDETNAASDFYQVYSWDRAVQGGYPLSGSRPAPIRCTRSTDVPADARPGSTAAAARARSNTAGLALRYSHGVHAAVFPCELCKRAALADPSAERGGCRRRGRHLHAGNAMEPNVARALFLDRRGVAHSSAH